MHVPTQRTSRPSRSGLVAALLISVTLCSTSGQAAAGGKTLSPYTYKTLTSAQQQMEQGADNDSLKTLGTLLDAPGLSNYEEAVVQQMLGHVQLIASPLLLRSRHSSAAWRCSNCRRTPNSNCATTLASSTSHVNSRTGPSPSSRTGSTGKRPPRPRHMYCWHRLMRRRSSTARQSPCWKRQTACPTRHMPSGTRHCLPCTTSCSPTGTASRC